MSLSPLAIATDFDSLYDGCLEVAGLLCRVCRFCYIRSRATEDRAGTWGWAVLGISKEDLGTALEQFQTNMVSVCLSRETVNLSSLAEQGNSKYEKGSSWRHGRPMG